MERSPSDADSLIVIDLTQDDEEQLPPLPFCEEAALATLLHEKDSEIAELKCKIEQMMWQQQQSEDQITADKSKINSLEDQLERKIHLINDLEQQFSTEKEEFSTLKRSWQSVVQEHASTIFHEQEHRMNDKHRYLQELSRMSDLRPPNVRIPDRLRVLLSANVKVAPSFEQLQVRVPLVSVRVIGIGMASISNLISSFLIEPNTISIDKSVRQECIHITKWLLANGAKPVSSTAHIALRTGNLEIAKIVFEHLNVASTPEVFMDFDQSISKKILAWLSQTYPNQIANELHRTSLDVLDDERWIRYFRYLNRFERHMRWDENFLRHCAHERASKRRRRTSFDSA